MLNLNVIVEYGHPYISSNLQILRVKFTTARYLTPRLYSQRYTFANTQKMSTKLVLTAPSVSLCEQTVELLRSLGIGDESIGVIASDQTTLPSLPSAELMENDIIPAVQRGGTAGALTGVIAGLGVALAAPGFVIGGAGLALAAVGGASFGALASGLIGTSVPNSHLQQYQEALEQGELLLIVDVPDTLEESIKKSLIQRFPSLRVEGDLSGTAPIK